MSTAQIIYEQYKVLPEKVKKELIDLINQTPGNSVLVSIEKGLEEIELIKSGKKQGKEARAFLRELQND